MSVSHSATDLPPVGTHLDVDGRRIFVHQAGSGAPAVVFLPGGGAMGLSYWNVHTRAAELTTSVVYDRAGTGWSDPVELPRLAKPAVEELRATLRAAAIPAPYLLVGHSLGGLYARRFAQLWPDEVAGLLMLDTAHEDYESNRPEIVRQHEDAFKGQPLPEFTAEQLQGFRPMIAGMYGDWPAELRDALVDRHVDPARFATGLLEGRNVDDLYAEVRDGGPLPAVPMIVVTALGIDDTQRMWATDDIIRGQNEAKLASHQILVRANPGAEHRVLEDASHAMLHARRPDAVIDAIRDLLGRIRD